MALSIRKKSVEDKARVVARRHSLTMTDAIERALDNEIARDVDDQAERREQFFAKLRVIQAAYANLPDSGLTEDQIMGWDETGLPT